jgi:hypothetical protein
MNDFTGFADLETEIDDIPAARPSAKPEVKFDCPHCRGTGRYQGVRLHQPASECFKCQGRGYFKTSPQQRQKSRQQAQQRKINKAVENAALFAEQHPAEYRWLQSVAQRSEFARSLLDGVAKYGSLTEGQLNAVRKCIAQDADRETQRAAREAAAPVLDLQVVRAKFDTARAAGIKRPILRLEGVVLTRAPDSGANAGCLYVKGGTAFEAPYYGKVTPEGRFQRARDCSDETQQKLVELAQDVLAAAVAYGKKTGACSCCGRELTNGKSIELGIGPICRERWGL